MPNTARIKSSLKKGFTLIELLVVIGILSVLAVAALVTINPAEAQRKARDTQRLQDIATIQAIVEQYLNDNPGTAITAATTTSNSVSGGVAANKACATGWLAVALGATVCAYANVLPIDPTNRASANVAVAGSTTTASGDLFYYLNLQSSGGYKICTHLESVANAAKLGGDGEGGTNTYATKVYAVFSTDIACGN